MNGIVTVQSTNGNHARQIRIRSTTDRFRNDVIDATVAIITLAKGHDKHAFFAAVIDRLELLVKRRVQY